MINYYKVLGVDQKATEAEIKNNYHKLARLYHPDLRNTKVNHEKFILINQAYSVLKNEDSRKAYDFTLREQENNNEPKVIYDAPVYTNEPVTINKNVDTNINQNTNQYSNQTTYLYNEYTFNEYYKSALKAFAEKSYVKAMNKIDLAIKVHPRSNKAHELKGDIYIVYTNYYEAKKEFEIALENSKNKKNPKLLQKIETCEKSLKPKKKNIFTKIKSKLFEEKE